MAIEFHTADSPERPGYEPTPGEHSWTFTFPIHPRGDLKLTMGAESRAGFIALLNEVAIDAAIEEALDHGPS